MNDSSGYTLRLCLLMVSILFIGTIGYVLIEGWTIEEALYMTVITITTVGFQEANPLSSEGRYFTMFLVFMGLGSVALFVSHIGRIVIEQSIAATIGGKRMQAKIRKLTNHYIICGYGRLGSSVCAILKSKGLPFVAIEANPDIALQAEKDEVCVVKGNATADKYLKEAGIERAIGIVAGLNDDADNLYISLASREMNKKILIISRSEEAGAEQRILRAGADLIVSPLNLGGKHIADLITRNNTPETADSLNRKMPGIFGFSLRIFRYTNDIAIPVSKALDLSGAIKAVALRKETGETIMFPAPDATILPEDTLIILTNDDIEKPRQ